MRVAPRIYPLAPRRAPEERRHRRRRTAQSPHAFRPTAPPTDATLSDPPPKPTGLARDKAKGVAEGKYHSGPTEIEPTRITYEAEKF